MNAKKYIISITATICLFPIIAQASNNKDLHYSFIRELTSLTYFEDITLPYSISWINSKKRTVNQTQKIIDNYSGIKITITHPNVYFSYLGEINIAPKKIEKADSKTFKLIETGTEIIAIDKNAVYLIYGDQQSRFPNIDTQGIKIIHKNLETKYLKSKTKTFSIQGTQLKEVIL